MQKRASLTATEEQTDINISPLIDMVFILLIFFIVTTVFVEEPGVEVNKPRAVSIENLEKNSILIAITSNARIVYGGKDIGIGGVRPIVQRLTQKDPMPVILQVDECARAPWWCAPLTKQNLPSDQSQPFRPSSLVDLIPFHFTQVACVRCCPYDSTQSQNPRPGPYQNARRNRQTGALNRIHFKLSH